VLNEVDLIDYLLEFGIVSTKDVVTGGLTVTDLSRRHRNLAVATRFGGKAFVKQQDARRSVATLAREAHVYDLFWRTRCEFAKAHMAQSRMFDGERGILVLNHLDGAEPLSTIETRQANVAEMAAKELGRTLALLHSYNAESCDGLAPLTPWVLSVVMPSLDTVAQLSAAAIATIGILQQSAVIKASLLELSPTGSGTSLTHGDMRLDNCLIAHDHDHELLRLVLVDWELAGVGDACYDIGAVLADYLSIWVRSMPTAASLAIAESVALAMRPLASIRPSVKAFWEGYQTQSAGQMSGRAILSASLRWTGARLVQSAIESAQEAASLSSTAVMLLQLAENVFDDPNRAARLIGIE
jgi:aminoglycoside phosphotransferase (APT) family kinase protein